MQFAFVCWFICLYVFSQCTKRQVYWSDDSTEQPT